MGTEYKILKIAEFAQSEYGLSILISSERVSTQDDGYVNYDGKKGIQVRGTYKEQCSYSAINTMLLMAHEIGHYLAGSYLRLNDQVNYGLNRMHIEDANCVEVIATGLQYGVQLRLFGKDEAEDDLEYWFGEEDIDKMRLFNEGARKIESVPNLYQGSFLWVMAKRDIAGDGFDF